MNFVVARRFGGEGSVDVPGWASSVFTRRFDVDGVDDSASLAVLDGLLAAELELEANS
jgi:hypothetical protein